MVSGCVCLLQMLLLHVCLSDILPSQSNFHSQFTIKPFPMFPNEKGFMWFEMEIQDMTSQCLPIRTRETDDRNQ